MFTIIKGAKVYAPEFLGTNDILLCDGLIAAVRPEIDENCFEGIQVADAEGLIVVPGFVDGHVHITGGGGEGGTLTRTPEVGFFDLIQNGITTVIGVLGFDSVTRSLWDLYAKADSLERQGMTALIYTGSYQVPVLTFTGSIQKDLFLIDRVVGVGEIALADHRSYHPTLDELLRISSEVRAGGMLRGKTGIVHFHLGDAPSGLDMLYRILQNSDIPKKHFLPTHVNRNAALFRQAVEYAQNGGFIDLTAGFKPDGFYPHCTPVPEALKLLIDKGVPIERITVSSDGNGSIPVFDEHGNVTGSSAASCGVLLEDIRRAVFDLHIPIEQVIRTVTSNPAERFMLQHRKGRIKAGLDADLLVFDESLRLYSVFALGKLFPFPSSRTPYMR